MAYTSMYGLGTGPGMKIKDKLHHVPCNLCRSQAYSILYASTYRPEDPAEEVMQQFRSCGGDVLLDQVVRCDSCGLVYINPRLEDEIIVRDYTEAAIHGYKEQFVSQNKSREVAFSRSMQLINRLRPSKGALLDVGAADGTFLAIARRQGWATFGCEPNRWFCRRAKENHNLVIDQGTLLEQDYAGASFDVITLWDVIEHTTDPTGLLKKCHSLLKPGGMIVFTYPDIGSWIARLMGRRWVFLMSVHLYYFSKKTASRMVRSLGFRPMKLAPHFHVLTLGYIAFRMNVYSAALSAIGKRCVDALRLQNLMVRYWIGVTCLVAEKDPAPAGGAGSSTIAAAESAQP